MKKFYVEFKRVAYLEIEVEAENPSEAEDLAWAALEKDPVNDDKDWYVNHIHKEEQ
jgi:hypothetical protein